MRGLFYAAALLLLASVVSAGAFVRWRARAIRRLHTGGELVTTRRGPIDCAFAGPTDAPPVVVLHGGLGGWDQGIMLGEDLGLDRDFRLIAPSRPGYLRTPLEAGKTVHEAADLLAALLDSRAIHRVHLVGVSGGGPTALAMAARHPDRIRSLVMVCAISHRHLQPAITTSTLLGRLVLSDFGAWFLDGGCWLALQVSRIAPAFMAYSVLRMTELGDRRSTRARVDALRQRPQQLRWILRLLHHSLPISLRKAGVNNDLAVFASLAECVSERVTAPVLVVHGRLDGNVPVEHAFAVVAASRKAESMFIDDAGHLLWLHPRADEVGQRVRDFLSLIPESTAGPSRTGV